MNEIIMMIEERVARIEELIEQNEGAWGKRLLNLRLAEARHLLNLAKETRCEVTRLLAKDAGIGRV